MKIFRGRHATKVLFAVLALELIFVPLLRLFPKSTIVLAVVVVLNLPAEIFLFIVNVGMDGKFPMVGSRYFDFILAVSTAGITAVTWAALTDFLFRNRDLKKKPNQAPEPTSTSVTPRAP